jgi:hypothetical protein
LPFSFELLPCLHQQVPVLLGIDFDLNSCPSGRRAFFFEAGVENPHQYH